jgi:hypothetical protein
MKRVRRLEYDFCCEIKMCKFLIQLANFSQIFGLNSVLQCVFVIHITNFA